MKKKIAVVAVALCLVIALVALCACTPSAKSLRSKYEKNDYKCEDITAKQLENKGFDTEDMSIDYAFSAVKGLDSVTVIAFKNKADADKMENQCKKISESVLGSIFGDATKTKYARKGNAIAIGSESAVKIFE